MGYLSGVKIGFMRDSGMKVKCMVRENSKHVSTHMREIL